MDRAAEAVSLLVEFVNTRDVEQGTDSLDTIGALQAWLIRHGLMHPEQALSPRDLDRARDLREGLRAVFRRHTGALGDRDDADILARCDRVLAEAPLRLTTDTGGVLALAPGGPTVWSALAVLIAEVASGPEWPRLKACQACQWAFYDRSKNLSHKWCSMAVCGSRMKARQYRRRRRAAAVGAAGAPDATSRLPSDPQSS